MSKVLVIGDSCTDVFVYGDIERVCPEAPVPVFNPIKRTENGGMAKNVVANLEALGVKVDVITNTNDIKNNENSIILKTITSFVLIIFCLFLLSNLNSESFFQNLAQKLDMYESQYQNLRFNVRKVKAKITSLEFGV